jgi:hypothetical protein
MIGSEWRAAFRSVVWGSRLPKWGICPRRIKFDRWAPWWNKPFKPVRKGCGGGGGGGSPGFGGSLIFGGRVMFGGGGGGGGGLNAM